MSGFVVTGGTGALGRVVVKALLKRGLPVAVPYRTTRGWEELQRTADGGQLWGAPADIADPLAAAAFVDEAAGRLHGLSGVAALAGAYAGSGPLETAPPSEWDVMLRSNLAPTYSICRAALPHLLKQGGSVVTVSSRLAGAGGDGAAAYAVSKAAVAALTRILALENRDRGVRFNCVAPGTIDTAENRKAMPDQDRSGWTSPDALAEVIVFLLTPAAAPVTGALIPADLGV